MEKKNNIVITSENLTEDHPLFEVVQHQEKRLSHMKAVDQSVHAKTLRDPIEFPGIDPTPTRSLIHADDETFMDVVTKAQEIHRHLRFLYPTGTPPDELKEEAEQRLTSERNKMFAFRHIIKHAATNGYNGQSVQMGLKAETMIATYLSSTQDIYQGLQDVQKIEEPSQTFLYQEENITES